jgi:hypothetical protein
MDIICRLQSQFGTAIPTTTPVAGLPGNDGINPEDTILWGNASLPFLDELLYLYTFPDNLPPWSAHPQGYYEPSSAEPSEGLGVCV